ncbi:glycoside hydrolase family 20 protein [Mucilaginibacter sp. KACC 22063]|uniref:glycoside hydrolase family 20 protein n=1 Tax=Mucilaginibacter sp. KACC 22063 TaxID=3025666 RepID=UPI0023652161|nr:family 20 glycosylhydrolase [Mucilaginibacter sp. KACC 22063]WDF54182.1 family 20 glycosylhydrolase [Mucilaginibacter sp. KACC 22063]
MLVIKGTDKHILFFRAQIIIGLCCILLSLKAVAQQAGDKPLPIIPVPVKAVATNGKFSINTATSIVAQKGINTDNLKFFNQMVGMSLSKSLVIKDNLPVSNYIYLEIDTLQQKDGYQLSVNNKRIIIKGHDEAGVFYGLQTVVQLMQPSKKVIQVQGCEITDYPRFAYRGMHLDVSRHMFPVSAIKKWIDVLALFKINTFHWHLTDDQGWRIEIKSRPKLQSVSAYRNETLIGHKKELPHQFDDKRYGGYYTQEEAKEIVAYARLRHITVIPEIEMPGHALAALAAYPGLGCTGGPYQTATFWGIFDDVYCAGNEDTFNFLEGVLDEVIKIFPSEYIHIGGDECPKVRWAACPKCQKRIKDEHLKDEHELQSYFIRRISNYLESKGRKIIGWDEILEGGLTPGATVMSWTGIEGGVAAAAQHHQVIMTPEKYVYLDYYQSLYPSEPLAAGGYTPLSKIYNYEPVPSRLTPEQAKYITGVQANIWSEYLPTVDKAEYMIFPRVLALSEMAWSNPKQRNYNNFLSRLRPTMRLLNRLHINAANTFDEITDSVSQTAKGTQALTLSATLPGAVIRYTTNGSKVTAQSKLYKSSLNVEHTSTISATTFVNQKQVGRTYTKSFFIHKAVGKQVTLTDAPEGNYNPPGGSAVLVNGLSGSARYNDNQWLGFNKHNFEAVVDLGKVDEITSLGTHVLNYHWQKMWAPTSLQFLVSDDNKTYHLVYQQTDFPVNGINAVSCKLSHLKARYIKVIAINKGTIPAGEYGAGGRAWLLLDEIIVN